MPATEIGRRFDRRRVAPVAVAATFAAVYVIVSPPSLDLAAHLLRTKLFRTEGFGAWSNWWYQGHHLPGYSIIFPPFAAALSPQLAAAIAATGTAALFEPLARPRFGERAWLAAVWFAAGSTATDLYTGRLAFAFGLLPAVGAALAMSRRRTALACVLGAVSALCSPVAALFVALAGGAQAIGDYLARRTTTRAWAALVPGTLVAGVSLLPVVFLAAAFPEGGTEPFALPAFWPIPVIGVVTLWFLPRDARTLRAGVVLYVISCVFFYLVPTPVGGNAARLGSLLAGPLAVLLLWPRRAAWLALVALPLLYLELQPPVRDVLTASGDPSHSQRYYQPLLNFLARQSGPPFRIEIPFTLFHWEAYQVAPRFPIARGWERQLDIKYNHLFYGGRLTAAVYEGWLHKVAVRFVAISDARLDYSAHTEAALLRRPPPYLRLVFSSRHWRVFEVSDATPIVSGAATLRAIDVNSLTLDATRTGTAFVRVHFTPYWALGAGSGCVTPAGDFTRLTLRRPGRVRLLIKFSPSRIGARSPRCG